MINATIQPNGNLLLTAGNDARAELAQMRRNGLNYWFIMAEAFESFSCNGSYTHFDAGQANPFVGLTSAPCIAESMCADDNGEQSIEGRVWWLSDYCTRDDIGELIAKGRTVYQFGFDNSETAQ